MLKRLSIALLFLMITIVLITPSNATTTRDQGMGLYDYPWFIDGLHTYIYENPAFLGKFKDEAFFERMGIQNGQSMGGIFYSPVSNFNIGVHLGYPVNNTVWNSTNREGLFHQDTYEVKGHNKSLTDDPATYITGNYQARFIPVADVNSKIIDIASPNGNPDAGSDTATEYRKSLAQRNVSALFSYTANKWAIGLNFGYATSWSDKRNSIDSSNNQDEYIFRNTEYAFGLGALYIINSKLNLDAAAKGNMYVLDNKYDATDGNMVNSIKYKSKGAMDFGGNVRLNAVITSRQTMHFNASYGYLNRSTEGSMTYTDVPATNDTDSTDTFSRTGQTINFGISDEMKISDELTAFIGFNVAYKTFKNAYSGNDKLASANNVDTYSNNITSIQLPLIVGMEGKLSTNWTARFGITSIIYQPLNTSGENITDMGVHSVKPTYNENSSSVTTLNIGFSYRLGNFSFDWLGNVNLFVTGPYLVSNKPWNSEDNSVLSMAFAVTYYFNFAGSDQKTDQDGMAPENLVVPKKK